MLSWNIEAFAKGSSLRAKTVNIGEPIWVCIRIGRPPKDPSKIYIEPNSLVGFPYFNSIPIHVTRPWCTGKVLPCFLDERSDSRQHVQPTPTPTMMISFGCG